MYPTLYHAFLDLFGIDLPALKFFNSFGFFVAVAFVAAHLALAHELKRKEAMGLLRPTTRVVRVGEAAKPIELLGQALIGFALGWKVVYAILYLSEVTTDPPGFLLSGRGHVIGGCAVAALFAWWSWWEKHKERLAKPEDRTVILHAAQHAGNITRTAALWGFIGAKLFSWFEEPLHTAHLLLHPGELLEALRNTTARDVISGLTIYGGLILAGLMVMRYFRRNGLAFWPAVDAAAPGVLLAYAIGRIGCQVAGDGDWGIPNPAPAPAWLPHWLWSYDYPNNVNAVEGLQRGGYIGERITSGTCFEGYCTHLVPGVFPTPLYETIMCLLLFGVLWSLRKRITTPGVIFCLFVFFDGAERFLIEKIRVNELFIGTWTQAEVISAVMVLGGAIGCYKLQRRRPTEPDIPA